ALTRLVTVPRLDRARSELLTDVAFTLADAALLLVAVLEVGDVDEGDGDGDGVLAPLPEHLAFLHVAAQVGFDLPPDDLLEARMILVNLRRPFYSLASPRAKMLATKFRTSVEQISQ